MLTRLLLIAVLLVAVAATASTVAAKHEPEAPRGDAFEVPLR